MMTGLTWIAFDAKPKIAKVDLLYFTHALKRRGLFENMEMKMIEHTFDLGDIITVFQMCPRRGLMIEGQAAIVEVLDDADEYYLVRFRNEPDETYQRFVDRFGQEDPEQYQREFNKKIGKVA